MQRIRHVAVAAVLVFLVALVAGPAFAQQNENCVTTYPPGQQTCDIATSDSNPGPGDSFTITAEPFDPGTGANGTLTQDQGTALAPMAFDGAILAQAGAVVLDTDATTVDSNGVATFTFTVPENAEPGPATVTASGTLNGAPVTYTATITIAGEAAGSGQAGDDGLPTTGGEFTVGAALAAIALLGGAALVVASRRRSDDVEAG